ncbi:hypothetical protein E2C01_082149 [Portunus trituberculatus]|uniref:Secreted protein n=1 Tax=Portunus trituberculatus TaxID=210409 RepID=A0A5B7IP73_PORTR|nr:hypothetical protein [Portunus trituberculatus]
MGNCEEAWGAVRRRRELCLMVVMMEVAVPVAGEEWPIRPSYNEVYHAEPSLTTPPNPEVSVASLP